jgi:apolipoprotein N-acyltransferase
MRTRSGTRLAWGRVVPALILLSGVLIALATADLGSGLLGFCALLPLLLAIDAGVPARRAATLGWLAGAIAYGVGMAWAPLAGIRGAPLAAVAAYVAVLGASVGIFAGALAWLRTRDRGLCFALAPLLWIGIEYARSRSALGYPWQQLGYSLADHPALLSLASVGGVYALSLWMASIQAAVVALRSRPALALLAAALGLVAPIALVREPGRPRAELRLAAVQPHVVEVGRRSDGVFRDNLARLLELSEPRRIGAADLLVWPESAYERTLRGDAEPLLEAIARGGGVPLLTGLWRRAPDGSLYNSAVLADPVAGVAHAGDKVHPVPLFEGAPQAPLERALAGVVAWPGAFRRGARASVVRLARGGAPPLAVGVLICLDSSYPELARDLSRAGASLLVELSNESRTGAWSARQHARVSRLRAVETGLSLVRVANTGPSEWVDPRGRVIARLPAGARASASHAVPIGAAPPPYVRLGDAPTFAAGGIPVLAVVLRRRLRPGAARARGARDGNPSHEVPSP